jgi:hypothetical protein
VCQKIRCLGVLEQLDGWMAPHYLARHPISAAPV